MRGKFAHSNFILLFVAWFASTVRLESLEQKLGTEYFMKNSSGSPGGVISGERLKEVKFYRCSWTHSVSMIARCPPGYSNREVIRKCEKGLFPLDAEDISIIVPVTGIKSRIHYANTYCATCHNESLVEFWELLLKWPTLSTDFDHNSTNTKTPVEILTTLHFDKISNEYKVNVSGEPTSCTFSSVMPDYIKPSDLCSPSVISECPTVYEGPKECDKFESRILVCTISQGYQYIYSNEDCARCNNVSDDSIVQCSLMAAVLRTNAAVTLFKLRQNSKENCSIPAIAKYYCNKLLKT